MVSDLPFILPLISHSRISPFPHSHIPTFPHSHIPSFPHLIPSRWSYRFRGALHDQEKHSRGTEALPKTQRRHDQTTVTVNFFPCQLPLRLDSYQEPTANCYCQLISPFPHFPISPFPHSLILHILPCISFYCTKL